MLLCNDNMDTSQVPKNAEILAMTLVFELKSGGRMKTRSCARGDLQMIFDNVSATVLDKTSLKILLIEAKKPTVLLFLLLTLHDFPPTKFTNVKLSNFSCLSNSLALSSVASGKLNPPILAGSLKKLSVLNKAETSI